MSEEEIKTSDVEDSATDDWSAAMEEQTEAESSTTDADWGDALEEQAATETADNLKTAEFQEFAASNEAPKSGSADDVNLDVILDVPVTISMEIGRTQVNIRNLLQLNQGSVVELDRLAGEPMDVLVNGTLVAHGEVVVVNEKFGIRLTDVISPSERVRRLA